ncbi:MAG: hypothetical protein JJE46_01595 [Acidimicrobiia bacterium]|nr:hypothetical protein [Acidimicrobiia bacterium]
MTTLAAHGIGVSTPAGWDGRISVRRDGSADQLFSASGTRLFQTRSRPVMHLANFGFPGAIGDFGSGAVELMGENDVFAVLFEHEPESTATALFRSVGVPQNLTAREFEPANLRRGIPGQSGYQAFFQESGRAFCLYVVLGSHARRARLVPLVNRVIASLEITPEIASGATA